MAKRKSSRAGGTIVTVNASGQKRPARRRRSGGGRRRGRARRALARYRSAPRWKQRATIAAAASGLGYLSGTQSSLYSRIPNVANLPVELTIAVGAHILAKGKSGIADDIATAASAIAGYKLGKAGFSMSNVAIADLSDLGAEFNELGYDDGVADMSDLADLGYDDD